MFAGWALPTEQTLLVGVFWLGPFMPGGLELGQVFRPEPVVLLAEHVQVIPGIDACVMVVIEEDLDGVGADLFELLDIHILLADLQFLLDGALHFGGG